jgi:hypothetical protein
VTEDQIEKTRTHKEAGATNRDQFDRHFLLQTLTSSAVTYTIVHGWTEKAKFNMFIKAADFRAAIIV